MFWARDLVVLGPKLALGLVLGPNLGSTDGVDESSHPPSPRGQVKREPDWDRMYEDGCKKAVQKLMTQPTGWNATPWTDDEILELIQKYNDRVTTTDNRAKPGGKSTRKRPPLKPTSTEDSQPRPKAARETMGEGGRDTTPPPPVPKYRSPSPSRSPSPTPPLNDYEMERERNIQANRARMASLGLHNIASNNAGGGLTNQQEAPRRQPPRAPGPQMPPRRSDRIQKNPPPPR